MELGYPSEALTRNIMAAPTNIRARLIVQKQYRTGPADRTQDRVALISL